MIDHDDLVGKLRDSKGWPTLGNAAANRIAELEAALRSVLGAADKGRMVERGAGGMSIEAQIRRSVYNGVPAWPIEEARAILDALDASQPAPAADTGQEVEPDTYDAGFLNDFGGGDVSWWHDYIRAELARAHEFYVSQWPTPAEGPEGTAEYFIQAAIDSAPEPLRRLGEWLANKLDDDDWNTADRLVTGAAVSLARQPAPDTGQAVEVATDLLHALKKQLSYEAALSGRDERLAWPELVKVRRDAIAKAARYGLV